MRFAAMCSRAEAAVSAEISPERSSAPTPQPITSRAALDEIEHALEILQFPVIGIGHVAQSEFRREIEKQPKMAAVIRRPQRIQKTQILSVHRDDPFESLEVVDIEAPRTLDRQIVAVLFRDTHRARIRLFAKLIVVRTG